MQTGDRALTGDFLHQAVFAGDAARRLLAMQDQEPLSPSYGSFHLAYWRDKTSEFADARFQEAGPALALLADPAFDQLRADRSWPEREVLLRSFNASLLNLARLQYAEGSYDEWYKGERGFAATAFTTFSFSMAALRLGDALEQPSRILLEQVMTRAGQWLARRDDLVKTNHEIVAAAALAAAARLLDDEALRAAARMKMQKSLAVQSAEGWFPELGGMDFGYSALILDYLHHYAHLMQSNEAADGARRLYGFMAVHMSPSVTFLGQAGICGNSYPGQVGYLASPLHDIPADGTLRSLEAMVASASAERIATYLFDDLRLCRWANLPLLAALSFIDLPERLPAAWLSVRPGWNFSHKAGVASLHKEGVALHLPYLGGAVLQVVRNGSTTHLEQDQTCGKLTTRGRGSGHQVTLSGDVLEICYAFSAARFLYPGLASRLILRLGSMTSPTSRLLRALIDRWRIKSGTAVNQSATAISRVAASAWVVRRISVSGETIQIVDDIHGPVDETVTFTINGQRSEKRIDKSGRLVVARSVDLLSGKVTVH